jgi:hypothetical protein
MGGGRVVVSYFAGILARRRAARLLAALALLLFPIDTARAAAPPARKLSADSKSAADTKFPADSKSRPVATSKSVAPSKSDAGPDAENPELSTAVGSLVDVETRNRYYRFVTLADGTRVQKSGALKALVIEPPPDPAGHADPQAKKKVRKGARLTLPIATVDRVWQGKKLIYVSKKAKPAQDQEDQYLARAKARGANPWPRSTWEEYQAVVAEQREFLKKVGAACANMALYETENFLFFSNIPPQQVGPYVVALDAMHQLMCKTYGIRTGAPVWKGKGVVVAFLDRADFLTFERTFMHANPQGAYGICHSQGDGTSVIACYRGDRPEDFAKMMVHETSHGFVHRYRTLAELPSWLNEGMAEVIGEKVVPKSTSVATRERAALERMKRTRNLGGNYFAKDQNIEAWQYGVASSMCKFMMAASGNAFVKFIDGIKEGMPWEESLKANYNATPEQLVSAYGRSVGIPDLRP